VRGIVLTKAERFENFRNRAIHASPIAFSMPTRSSDDTIVSATVTLRNSTRLGDTAADQFSRDGPLARFQTGDFRAELAVLAGDIAGREIVERWYNGNSLGMDCTSILGLGPVGRVRALDWADTYKLLHIEQIASTVIYT